MSRYSITSDKKAPNGDRIFKSYTINVNTSKDNAYKVLGVFNYTKDAKSETGEPISIDTIYIHPLPFWRIELTILRAVKVLSQGDKKGFN